MSLGKKLNRQQIQVQTMKLLKQSWIVDQHNNSEILSLMLKFVDFY